MTQVGRLYADALYTLAREEAAVSELMQQLTVLWQSFAQEPDFIRLLNCANLSRQERCRILDDSFRGKVHIYVLNFLKILTEKGYIKHFSDCCAAFEDHYNHENDILIVTAVTAAPLTHEQAEKLTGKLSRITGRLVKLRSRIDPAVYGGVRLDYDGKRLDDTISHRLVAIRRSLIGSVHR